MPINADDRYHVWIPGGSKRGQGSWLGHRKYKQDAIDLAHSIDDPEVQIWDTKGHNPVDGQTGCSVEVK